MNKVLKRWLPLQCRILGGSINAALFLGPPDQGPFKEAMRWPAERPAPAALSRAVQAALRSRQTIIKTRHSEAEETGEPRDALACPLVLGGRLCGVVAFDMPHRSQPLQRAAVQQARAGVMWLEVMLGIEDATAADQGAHLVDLVAAGLDHEAFRMAATEVVNELAERFACLRVSLGFLHYGRLRVEAMSHSSSINHNAELTRRIRDAMNEALDNQSTIVYPPPAETPMLVTHFHANLSSDLHGAGLCTIPLVKNGKAVGALLLERTADKPFGPRTVTRCEQIGLLLGPVLQTRRSDERALPLRAVDSGRQTLVKLFGPRHLGFKLAATLAATLVLLLASAQAPFRISGDSMLEAGISRAIVAPQQGFIASATVRAGDLVREGQLLAALDDSELLQERRKWRSQRGQLLKEYRKALAHGERAEVAILDAKRTQAEAQLELVEKKLERIRLIAPFSGLIVSGDLSQALGSPVERGESLFEIAPMADYRVVMKVDDRDIGFIEEGQKGRLKLAGIPDRRIAITIDRLTPVATCEGGRNYFRVEARLDHHSDLMRPGMAGISKIEVGREKLLWIGVRRLLDWVRMFAWTRLP
jgi:multidrug efflux pump subunit AcrA (membrane-fusion protein)